MERYDFTRLRTYQLCPKKHEYIYTDGIRSASNINIMLGTLFHQCLEGHYCDDTSIVDDALSKYKKEVRTGSYNGLDEDLLEYCLAKYTQYYSDKDDDEDLLGVESEFTDPISETEEFYLRIDRVVYNKKTKLITLRDTKTTQSKLKYGFDDVNYNTQLLTYVPFVENYMSIKIDQIEIDEMRLCKLQPTPINANGKPTGDRHRLEFTTYEDYMDTINSMHLEYDPAYKTSIEYMAKRPHPMFNRVSAQILDHNIVDANLRDMNNTMESLKAGANFRNKGVLCDYCDYKNLCRLDMFNTSNTLRDMEINKIKTGKK